MQLISGRTWQDNWSGSPPSWRVCPGAPLLVLLPENFALFGERQGYLDGQSYWAMAQSSSNSLIGPNPTASGWWPGPCPPPSPVPTTSTPAPWCSIPTASSRAYHKIHLFDVDVADNHGRYRESETFSPGDQPVLVDSPFGPLGLSICYDLRFPELYRQLARAGARCCWCLPPLPPSPARRTGSPLRARAIENQCYVVAANQGAPTRRGARPGATAW